MISAIPSQISAASNTKYVILSGGESKQTKILPPTLEGTILEGKIIDESNYIVEKMPNPEKGMRVQYATDGYVLDIIIPNKEVEYPEIRKASKQPRGILPSLTKVAQWGSIPNCLYTGLGWTVGTGRATTFSDKIGQADHKLVKGDVATKLAYDNCKVGTKIIVDHNAQGKQISMTKWDAGGMPNAVLDIWKTGVEFFGHEWDSTFSLPGTVVYSHL